MLTLERLLQSKLSQWSSLYNRDMYNHCAFKQVPELFLEAITKSINFVNEDTYRKVMKNFQKTLGNILTKNI